MKLSDVVYSLGWQTIRPLLAVASLFSPKLAQSVAGRKSAVSRMRAWGADRRPADDAGELVWLHGASAGELAGAAPVVAELQRSRPGLRLAVTYSSPSAEPVAVRLESAYHGFVPFDLRRRTDAAVQALRPAALVYAKHDVWPNLTASARRAGVPTGLINATVRPGSARLRQPGRALLKRAYRSLDAVGAVSAADRERLEALGVRPEAIRVTGDASFDQAVARLAASGERALRLPSRPPGVVRLIAGSTWPDDEDLLIEAVGDLDAVELVLVPHEPTPAAVEHLRAVCLARFGQAPRLFSELDPSIGGTEGPRAAPPPLIVDAVGVLAELYAEGDVGYVGGAIAATGLHSVIEPAAAGLPVLFGPHHDRREANELVEAGAAFEVDATSIYATLVSLHDTARRRRMGQTARDYVAAHVGADRKGAELVESLLDR
ncbi:MAG TPA: glycosyltransferase N-terminal domain-containing protein [Gemmatimonadota bacterium]|nr:glycosyltransferase N-terminal domain-containing protein [Gemmatimonadota bacterium]